jgi:hypothetical protein
LVVGASLELGRLEFGASIPAHSTQNSEEPIHFSSRWLAKGLPLAVT